MNAKIEFCHSFDSYNSQTIYWFPFHVQKVKFVMIGTVRYLIPGSNHYLTVKRRKARQCANYFENHKQNQNILQMHILQNILLK